MWWIAPAWLFLMLFVVQWISDLINRPGLEASAIGLTRGIAAFTPLAVATFAFVQALSSRRSLALHVALALVFGLAATMTAHALLPQATLNDAAILLWPPSYLVFVRFPAHEPSEVLRLLQWGSVCAIEEILVLLLLWWSERKRAVKHLPPSSSGEALEGQ